MLNALTVDVEEYFHPTELQNSPDLKQWTLLPSRVEDQTKLVLDLLARHQTKATFFVLGWVAQHRPRIVRQILNAGHEIGCHSYAHELVFNLTPQQFRRDLELAVLAIEDAGGNRPKLYRAPSYSITRRSMWALEVLVELGFTHDSSIYPIPHDRYGIPGFSRHSQIIGTPSGPIWEIPIATVSLGGGRVAPVGGGGYLRLLPYCYTAAGIRRINNDDGESACMYFHPWELDPAQPKLASGVVSRLRTYTGLKGMPAKLERLLTEFRFSSLSTVYPAARAAPVRVLKVRQMAAG
jgi:polysaccharide deacetylase family protein (PEP-CTERM system associated)